MDNTAKRQMYVDGGEIVDNHGRKYTEAEAREVWESGEVDDYNLAFKRLMNFNFSLASLEQFYREDESKRKQRLPQN
jgi:hypothetical protein